jgi:hypothetical protein
MTPQRGHAGRPWSPLGRPGQGASPTAACRFWHSLAFLIPALLATDYTVNRFYTLGAAMWDSGWFAHLTASGLRNPPAIGGCFLSDHMSLVLVITALVHKLIPKTPAPIFFALTQGVWFGLIGLAASLCLRPLLPTVPAVTLSVLCAMNGISLAAIGFPHIEIAISALILLILALWARGYRRIAWMFVPLLLMVREDAGLHLATIVGLISVWRWHTTRSWHAALPEAMMAAAGLLGSAAILAVQEALFVVGEDQLHETYLGTPMLAHVDWAFLGHRIYRLGQNRSYIYLPFLITIIVAMRRREFLFALGPLAGVPWVLLALVARSSTAGELMSYYAFPLMIGLCWPMIAAHPALGGDYRVASRLFAANIALSVTLFAFSGGMHDRRPWQSFGLPDPARIDATESALDEILASRRQLGPFIVDDAVGALRPSAFRRSELRMLMDFTPDQIRALHFMVFMPVAWLAERKAQIISEASLTWHYRIAGTSLLLYSRTPLHGLGILRGN